MTEPDPTTDIWCEPDGCPASICNGPHVSHHCPNGDLVTVRYDNEKPCPGCGAVINAADSVTDTSAPVPPAPASNSDGMTFTAADQQELDALECRAEDLNLELRARGGSMPLGPVRLEALIDFLFGDESPERLCFELHFRRNQVALLQQGVAQAAREALTRGVRGPGNGRPHTN